VWDATNILSIGLNIMMYEIFKSKTKIYHTSGMSLLLIDNKQL
jgi:hypothetical protein